MALRNLSGRWFSGRYPVAPALALAALFAAGSGACSRTDFSSGASQPQPSPSPGTGDADPPGTTGDGTNGAPNGAGPTIMTNPNIKASDLNLACGVQDVKAAEPDAQGSQAQRLFVPLVCVTERVERPDPNRGMDIVFVHDVTGSMRAQIDIVRAGYLELVQDLANLGWNLRVGAIAFADQIDAVIPLTANTTSVHEATSPTVKAWSAPQFYGEDLPEQGLMALDCAIQVLAGEKTCHFPAVQSSGGEARDKTIIYVSDAPARDALGKFEVSGTASRLSGFAKLMEQRSASLKLFYSAAHTRKNFMFDEWPTPDEQLDSLVAASGIAAVKVAYPLTSSSFKSKVADKLREGKVVVDSCALVSVEITGPDGGMVLPLTKIKATSSGAWVYPVQKFARGTYTVESVRQCSGAGLQTTKTNVEL